MVRKGLAEKAATKWRMPDEAGYCEYLDSLWCE